jgi:hypothetical protein
VQLALVGSLLDGTSFLAVDCARIVGPTFEDDDPIDEGIDTDIVVVWNTYSVGGQFFRDEIDFLDAELDTVPFGSWITVFYGGEPDPANAHLCTDFANRCLSYQKSLTSRAAPFFDFTTAWLPHVPEDNDLLAIGDSTSLNAGSAEYTFRARSVDDFGSLDTTPAEIRFVSNLQPTLTSLAIEMSDGTAVEDGGSVVWDWWRPANFHGAVIDTLDTSDPTNLQVVREFIFLVKAEGRDHPKEERGGVKSWKYTVQRSDDPSIVLPLGRSGTWVEGSQTNTLCDTIRFTVRYSYLGDPGGWNAWRSLPDWLNQSYDVSMLGRDTGPSDEFDQYMFVNGAKTLINSYSIASLGRHTEEGSMRFSLLMSRDDVASSATDERVEARISKQ